MTDTPVNQENSKPARDERGRLLPGHTANPNGRPKKELCLTSLLKEWLLTVPDAEKEGRTNAELTVEMLGELARQGEPWAVKEVLNRIDGTPTQRIEQITDNTIHVEYTNDLEVEAD
jgi:hypothetical protein